MPPDEPEGCPYGEAVLLADVMPDADEFLDMVDCILMCAPRQDQLYGFEKSIEHEDIIRQERRDRYEAMGMAPDESDG